MQLIWKLLIFMCFTKITSTVPTYFNKTKNLILTTYIKENRFDQAKLDSKVNPSLFLNISSHSGFFTVDQRYNSNLFFWYFPISTKPVNATPLIIWLQGGPGATSLAGLFDEIGPLEYDIKSQSLKKRENNSWGKEYSLLFIDSPVGTGFSYTDDDELGYATNMKTYGNHLYSALEQFLTVFSELRNVSLYIAGESYAGRYVVALAEQVLRHNSTFNINLQGLIMGNPVLDRDSNVELSTVYYNLGLIDAQGLEAAKPLQDAFRDAVAQQNSMLAVETREELLHMLDALSDSSQSFNFLKDKMTFNSFVDIVISSTITDALHIGGDHLFRHPFTFSNQKVKKHLIPDFLVQVTSVIEELLDHYEVLIYCGQLDLTAPCTLNSLPRRVTWKWKNRGQFMKASRLSWYFNENVAGYIKSGGGLTEVLVRGAGHMTPIDKPEATLHLITNFITKTPFITPSLIQQQLNIPLEISLDEKTEDTETHIVLTILSVILNVILIIGIISWIVRKRIIIRRVRNDWMYDAVSDNVVEVA